jgi:hypothetical protein
VAFESESGRNTRHAAWWRDTLFIIFILSGA